MKITFIHGENTVESRNRLSSITSTLKKRGWDVVELTKDKDKSLSNAVSTSQGLFTINTLFVVENAKEYSPSELEKLSKMKSSSSNILLYYAGLAPQKIIKSLPDNIHIEHYDPPRTIFNFLDTIAPGNAKKVLKGLDRELERGPIELVFALLAKHFRDLYWIKVAPETYSAQSWKRSKVLKQSKLFTEDRLKNILEELAKADIDAKTSILPLRTSLDLIITKELE